MLCITPEHRKWPITSEPRVCVSLLLPGAGEVYVSSGAEPGDGPQRPADPQQIPAHPRQGPVPQKPTVTHQGTD